MKPPPLARWMMDAFNDAYGPDTWAGEWTIFEDEGYALLSLLGKNDRSADVWVKWEEPLLQSDAPEVTLCVIVGDGQPFVDTPQELAEWLRGAA